MIIETVVKRKIMILFTWSYTQDKKVSNAMWKYAVPVSVNLHFLLISITFHEYKKIGIYTNRDYHHPYILNIKRSRRDFVWNNNPPCLFDRYYALNRTNNIKTAGDIIQGHIKEIKDVS